MLTQRTRGLQTTVLFCQALVVALVFVVVAQVTFAMFFAGSPAGIERYPIYCGLLILGLAVEALYRDKEDSSFGRGFLVQHGVALRQSACAIGVLLVFLAAAKDAFISRTFLAFLAPSVYVALLWSNASGRSGSSRGCKPRRFSGCGWSGCSERKRRARWKIPRCGGSGKPPIWTG